MKELVVIDTYECNGCGSCVSLCPDVFEMDQTGDKALVREQPLEITPDLEKAAAFCPQVCIILG